MESCKKQYNVNNQINRVFAPHAPANILASTPDKIYQNNIAFIGIYTQEELESPRLFIFIKFLSTSVAVLQML
jgi:hypothetical protein